VLPQAAKSNKESFEKDSLCCSCVLQGMACHGTVVCNLLGGGDHANKRPQARGLLTHWFSKNSRMWVDACSAQVRLRPSPVCLPFTSQYRGAEGHLHATIESGKQATCTTIQDLQPIVCASKAGYSPPLSPTSLSQLASSTPVVSLWPCRPRACKRLVICGWPRRWCGGCWRPH
jgi:hypothetical protein